MVDSPQSEKVGASNLRRALYAGLALLLILGVGLAISTSIARLPDLEWRLRPEWVALAIGAMALYLTAAAELWRRVLIRLGPNLEPAPAYAAWFGSALGRYVPTGLLLPVMRVAMVGSQGVSKRICMVSVVYELALTLVAAAFVAAYFVFELPQLEGAARYGALAIPLLVLPALHPAVLRRMTNFAMARMGLEEVPIVLSFRSVLGFVAAFAVSFVSRVRAPMRLPSACIRTCHRPTYPR